MERRDFLKIALGMAAGAVVTVRAAQAMTPPPSPLKDQPPIPEAEAKPAVATSQDIEEAKVEKVQWRHRRWRRHHWHRRRHWGWHRRRHWRHRHWRHRHWRRRYYYY